MPSAGVRYYLIFFVALPLASAFFYSLQFHAIVRERSWCWILAVSAVLTILPTLLIIGLFLLTYIYFAIHGFPSFYMG
jgi:hypothetical protein